MGLFDTVIPEFQLPDADAVNVDWWQTKDFDDPYMENYKITSDGRLLHEEVHYEDHSDKNAPPGSFESILGCMTPVHERWVDLNFHGILNFYGTAKPSGEWFEYNAKFTDGTLVSIERLHASA